MRVLGWDLFRVTTISFIENYVIQGLIMTTDTVVVPPLGHQDSAPQVSSPEPFYPPRATSSGETPKVKVFRQAGRNTLQKAKRLCR